MMPQRRSGRKGRRIIRQPVASRKTRPIWMATSTARFARSGSRMDDASATARVLLSSKKGQPTLVRETAAPRSVDSVQAARELALLTDVTGGSIMKSRCPLLDLERTPDRGTPYPKRTNRRSRLRGEGGCIGGVIPSTRQGPHRYKIK